MTTDTVPLKEYFDSRLLALEKAVVLNDQNSRIAIDKAEASTSAKFVYVNELRGALSDLSSKMLLRTEYDRGAQAMSEKIDSLTQRVTGSEARGRGAASAWALLAAGVGVIISLISGVAMLIHFK